MKRTWIFIIGFLFQNAQGDVPQVELLAEPSLGIIQRIGNVFEEVMRKSTPEGQIMKRPVFGKAHGCLKARFEVQADLPDEWKVGAFSESGYDAWIRFANDGSATASDTAQVARGMAIKLLGVKGRKILPGEEEADTQDFIMQNHPVFFSNTAQDFLEFLEANTPRKKAAFDKAHPETQKVLDEMHLNLLADPLDGQYWTPTPYRLGAHVIKYMVKPCSTPPPPQSKPMQGDYFLRENLLSHLLEPGDEKICMGFWVQFQKDDESMPIDKATVKWSEEESEFIQFATLYIAKAQNLNINDVDHEALCENLSFTGWHSLPEHEPLGTVNLARKIVYKRMADARRAHNKVLVSEPTQILPTD